MTDNANKAKNAEDSQILILQSDDFVIDGRLGTPAVFSNDAGLIKPVLQEDLILSAKPEIYSSSWQLKNLVAVKEVKDKVFFKKHSPSYLRKQLNQGKLPCLRLIFTQDKKQASLVVVTKPSLKPVLEKWIASNKTQSIKGPYLLRASDLDTRLYRDLAVATYAAHHHKRIVRLTLPIIWGVAFIPFYLLISYMVAKIDPSLVVKLKVLFYLLWLGIFIAIIMAVYTLFSSRLVFYSPSTWKNKYEKKLALKLK